MMRLRIIILLFAAAVLATACVAGAQQPPRKYRSLGELAEPQADSAARMMPDVQRLQVDDAKAAAEGIRKLTSKRLTLYTDLPSSPEIDRLPALFDQAFPQWCAYFGIDPAAHDDWSMTGFLMREKLCFHTAGLLPDHLPPFRNGYSVNHELWMYDQPSDYYRRHLLLHEGTHGFMNTLLGGCGPPWYMEGIAELMATHQFSDGRVTLNHMPANRDEVPYWGRIKMIKDAVREHRLMQLKQVIEYPTHAHRDTEPYAWCWAAAALLDRDPRYRARFRQLSHDVLAPDFNQRFYRALAADWDELCEQWQLMVSGLEYGYDVAAAAVELQPGQPLPPEGATVTVSAERSWQSSGLRLRAGQKYLVRARGRYQVANRPQSWWCEPGGVSIRYYHGRPLGMLLAAVRDDEASDETSALLQPTTIGLSAVLEPKHNGTLYLRINDSAAELGDNAGELQVHVQRQ